MKNGLCVLVAGGTGGHINAAIAIGEKCIEKNFEVLYITGKRPLDYKLYKDQNVIHIDSQALRTKNPFKFLLSIIKNIKSFFQIMILFIKKRPRVVIGCGGYVCGPTLLAGFLTGLPVYILEQNAFMGLTNKILGWISTKIFVHFKQTKGLSSKLKHKCVVVGNPVRKSISNVKISPIESPLKVLVFGGSLGATQINLIIEKFAENYSQKPIWIIHQTGNELPFTKKIPDNIKYERFKYLDEIQKQYEWCDIIISRSGASTVSELRIVKKPVLIFPYPQATDNHQYYNANELKKESSFTVEVSAIKNSEEQNLEILNNFINDAINGKLNSDNEISKVQDSSLEILKEVHLC
jgi:UDP-N-acetylglucosamine--N-acetylmuramyl-(pentapeptide) pyrophosphoryl-undecaprenol N-acetylglucosamine transferase